MLLSGRTYKMLISHRAKSAAAEEKQLPPNPLLEQLSGEAGAAARAQKLEHLADIEMRIQAQRNRGASRQGFQALEHLSHAVAVAREIIEKLAKSK
jgi:hypothetical protein